ncbi:MAG: NAD-dependent epimerase/dehydratase family protein, partial [Chloroflexi bacterium]
MNGNSLRPCVLLTGATGFLGAQIARRLLKEPGLTVIALVRAENQVEAERRLERAWWDRGGEVEVLPGDLSLPHLGLDEPSYARLAGRVTHIIHSAADLRVDAPIEDLRRTNVQGTANLLELARLVQRDHGLERYAHVSTAYVAGRRNSAIPEADLSGADGFSNAYEQSKYEAECLVRAAKSELPISVFRPGMIVGAADTGEIRTFNTVYFPLRLYLSGKLPVIPADPALPVNIVPVDYVAEAVARLTFCPEAEGLNFHLTAPAGSLPKAGELVEFAREWARERLGLNLPGPLFLRAPHLSLRRSGSSEPSMQSTAKRLKQSPVLPIMGEIASFQGGKTARPSTRNDRLKALPPTLRGLLTLLPYFNERKQFQRDNVDRLLGPYPLDWHEFLPRLLAYAVDQGFLHRTERTVHEQILARL